MTKFVYYEIDGFLPSSFVSNRLGNNVRFSKKEKAISVLEAVLSQWKEQESFEYHCELISECILDDVFGYHHQFVFKSSRTGWVWDIDFKVKTRKIFYE